MAKNFPELSRRRLYTSLFALTIVWSLAVWAGVRGVDFGYHWDEQYWIMDNVRYSLETGIFLPGKYNYPSMCYNLSVLSLIPRAVQELFSSGDLPAKILEYVGRPECKIAVRTNFILITYLSVFWIFVLVRKLVNHNGTALLAAALLGLSWEISYHARWIAPDAVMMQFGIFTMMCVVLAYRDGPGFPRLEMAAAGAGLAAGTKYPAFLLMVPVMVLLFQRGGLSGAMIGQAARLAGIFLLVFLATTPGMVLEPDKFGKFTFYEIYHYARLGHAGHTVAPGLEHLGRIMLYYLFAAFSGYPAVSFVLCALGLAGVIRLLRTDRTAAMLLLSFPAAYILLFAAQRVMIVRNLLVVFPFLCVLSAIGFQEVWERAGTKFTRAAVCLLMAGMLSLNAYRLIHAAESIAGRTQSRPVHDLARYLEKNSHSQVWISPKARAALSEENRMPPNAVDALSRGAEYAVFDSGELDYSACRSCNYPFYAAAWFGPFDVNYNYYPDWEGASRFVIMPTSHLENLDVFKKPADASLVDAKK